MLWIVCWANVHTQKQQQKKKLESNHTRSRVLDELNPNQSFHTSSNVNDVLEIRPLCKAVATAMTSAVDLRIYRILIPVN